MPSMLAWAIDPITGHMQDIDPSSGKDSGNQFLILGVVLLVVWFLLTAMFSYYVWQFKKTKSNTKLYGRTMLIVNLGLSVIELVFAILTLVFWGDAGKIFGYDNGAGAHAYSAAVAMVVLGFIDLAALFVMMWFFLPYYGIAFDQKRILFMGEDIPYASITKIVSDTETGATYINYTKGKRSHKKLKFSAASAFGLFIKKNASLTGHAVEDADEKSYYQSLMNSDKHAEKEFDKEVSNKVRNKSARSTGASADVKTLIEGSTKPKAKSTSSTSNKSRSKSTSTSNKTKKK